MILRIAGAIGALCLSTSAAQTELPVQRQFPLVHQVICAEGKGTAFRVGKRTFLSVAHVTKLTNCTIDGTPFTATNDGDKDFSVLDVPIERLGGFKINCDGFIPGEWYFAIGHAKGLPWQTTVRLLATYVKDRKGERVLLGYPTVIPGMSGGPILNKRGEAVGTVNRYGLFSPISLSRQLRDTSVCQS